MEPVEDIVIVGAGPTGLATAIGLHRRGVKSLVLESSPTLRTSEYVLGLWTNAWYALDALGVGDKVREHHTLVERVVVLSSDATSKKMRLQVQGKSGKLEFRSVRRDSLVEILAKELPKDTIRYSSKVVSIEENSNLKLLFLADGSIVKAKVVVGCDGIYSAVAKYIGLKEPSFSGHLSTRGFAEYPTNHGFKPEFLVITGKGFHAGMLPCSDRSVYWFFTWKPSKKDKIDQSMTKMQEFIIQKLTTSKAPKEFIQVIERSEMSHVLSSDLKCRHILSITPLNTTRRRNTCVIGDAVHATTPNLGLGNCIALEDSVVLARYLSDAVHKGKLEEALKKFADDRWHRWLDVSAGVHVVGFILKSTYWFLRFTRFSREEFSARMMAKELLELTNYNCGKL